jgi:hypothetical protein
MTRGTPATTRGVTPATRVIVGSDRSSHGVRVTTCGSGAKTPAPQVVCALRWLHQPAMHF